MGTFKVRFEVGDPAGTRFEPLEALVDTGAFYSWVPVGLLAGLGVSSLGKYPFVTADGRTIERDVGEARIRLDGGERTTLVVFGDAGSTPLLGAYTLEGFGLAADPVNRRLVPATLFMAPLQVRSTRVPGIALSLLAQPEREQVPDWAVLDHP